MGLDLPHWNRGEQGGNRVGRGGNRGGDGNYDSSSTRFQS